MIVLWMDLCVYHRTFGARERVPIDCKGRTYYTATTGCGVAPDHDHHSCRARSSRCNIVVDTPHARARARTHAHMVHCALLSPRPAAGNCGHQLSFIIPRLDRLDRPQWHGGIVLSHATCHRDVMHAANPFPCALTDWWLTPDGHWPTGVVRKT